MHQTVEGPARKIKTGLIGCGNIAPMHADALSLLPESEFLAVCDADSSRSNSLATKYSVPEAHGSLTDLLGSGIDALLVCTPHPAHESIVIQAAEAGVHVLCEKPIAVQLDQADRMIEAADRAGVNFGVIFQRRFWPAAQRIRTAIDDGSIGFPTLGLSQTYLWRPKSYFAMDEWRGKWETEGGGVLMNQAVHMIDMLQWYMGPVTEVYGKHVTLVHQDYIDVEDTAVATLVFESGALGLIQATTTVKPDFGFRVSIHGSNGTTLSVWEHPEGNQGINDTWTLDATGEQPKAWEAEEGGQSMYPTFHRLQIEDFLRSIIEQRPPAVTGAEARKSLAIILAIYESSRSGKPVRL
ncbi:Gfo/Idh/MocA family oxidoreductase [soil metagenome]